MSELSDALRNHARRETQLRDGWAAPTDMIPDMSKAADELDAKDTLIADLLSTFSVRDASGIMVLEKDNQKFVAALVALSKASQD